MRTKALLLTAAVLTAGLASSVAQSVYSVNAVGYVNLNLPAGYSLIANPLNGTNNNLNTILPVVPVGSQILTWNAANQTFDDAIVWFPGVGWSGGSLNPGQGAFLNLPTPATITFVGEVPQGNLTNNIPVNYGLLSHMVPQAIGLAAANLPASPGDQVLFWDRAAQAFEEPSYVFFPGAGWTPSDPVPDVGEGFFYLNTGGTVRSWGRTFSVN